MKRTIFILLCACVAGLCLNSCGEINPPVKEKMLWMDAEASFMTNFSTKEKITALLDKIKDTGFNKIVVDVRPVEGDVLYSSDFMTPYKDSATRGWDYLQFMIDEAGKRDIKVTVSTTIFTAGYLPGNYKGKEGGPVWRDPELAELACVEYTPDDGLISILDDLDKPEGAGRFAFLNPVNPAAQAYVLRFIEEIVTKYDFDGYALDYCRFPDAQSDFSDYTKGEFEKYIGKKTENWPGDVFTYNPDGSHNKGAYYYEWWQFRSGVIHDFVATAKARIKAIKPNVKLEYWTGSWLAKDSGQNWASSSYDLSTDPDNGSAYREWLTADYSKNAIADLLDVYLLGTYMTDVYMGDESPDGTFRDLMPGTDPQESLEYQLARGKKYVGGVCPVYGNVSGTQGPDGGKIVEEQIYYCLKNSDGVMVFDVCHFIDKPDYWAGFKRGIARAEKELAEKI